MAYPIATSKDEIGMFLQESLFNNNDEPPLCDVSDPNNNIIKHLKRFFLNVLLPFIIEVPLEK